MNNAMNHHHLNNTPHQPRHDLALNHDVAINAAPRLGCRRFMGRLLACWMLLLASFMPFVWAHNLHQPTDAQQQGNEHQHDHSQQATSNTSSHHDAVGPQGGRLLQQDDFAVEITMFTAGLAPEMRVYSYAAQQPLSPDAVQLQIRLTRLEGAVETLSFHTEQDYAVSTTPIAEPHAYQVSVQARYQGRDYQWQFATEEGRITLRDRVIAQSGIKTEPASARQLQQQIQLFGVIAMDPTRHWRLQSPYAAAVQQVWVTQGQQVNKGQPLLELHNTTTLKTFTLRAPADGVVTQRHVNPGQVVTSDTLLEIVDFSQVNVELSVFPTDLPKIHLGQAIAVMDLHNAQHSNASINFIAPAMTDGHIARVRAQLANPQGQWRPGMHINAHIQVAQHQVAIAVPLAAIQYVQGREVVFIRVGNTFEMRQPQFGRRDHGYIEVLSGLTADVEVVTTQSYLLKAELEKEGLSHAH